MATSVLVGAATAGLAAMLMAIADFTWELPIAGRAFWLILATLSIPAGFLVGLRHVGNYSMGKTAADVERQIIAFGQRLRTTHDYQHQSMRAAPASPSLVDALRDDTYGIGRRVDWDDAVNTRPLIVAIVAGALIAATWVAALALSPEFRTAAGRVLLLPWEYTTVAYEPQVSTVRPGDSVEITVVVSGRPVDTARLRYRSASGQVDWEACDLAPLQTAAAGLVSGLHGRLGTKLSDLEQNVEFEVLAGPRPLPTGSIRVLQPLAVEERHVRVIPPAYTGRDEQMLASFDIKVPEGSTVELRLVLNRPASEARLALTDSGSSLSEGDSGPAAGSGPSLPKNIPLVIEANTLRANLADLRTGVSGIITARAADGMTLDPEPLALRVQLDRQPDLKFIEPAEELVVTPTTEVPIRVEVNDDIGLHRMGILFQINDGPMQTLWEGDARGSVDPQQMATVLLLEEHSLIHQDGVTYHAFAEDNYFGQPRRTTTPLRFIDIRPFKLAYQLVDSGGT